MELEPAGSRRVAAVLPEEMPDAGQQGFDAFGRVVEARRQKGHLILTALGDANGQVAFAPFLNPVL